MYVAHMHFAAFNVFYILGQLMAMQIPFVGLQPIRTSEHMAAAGIFGLLQVGVCAC
jgi:dolichyl-diphosphooligosaccharide--protein glycosyltransferase